MASVYGNSTRNIAAKGADSHAGCFVQRNPLSHRPCQLTQTEDSDPTQGVYAHPYPTANYTSFNLHNYANNAPLLERAWVQQERLLPPRILYFGGPKIHWECYSLQASETWPSGPPSDEHGFDEVIPLNAAFETELHPFNEWSNDDYYTFIFGLWRNGIVHEYTAAKLSFEKDRLAALAGIASVIRARTGVSFVAGLWKELLPLELLWHRDISLVTGENQRNNGGEGWKAPSWSWVSVIGKVRYAGAALSHPQYRKETHSCQVIDCHTVPLETDAPILGELSDASLTLKGRLALIPGSFAHLTQEDVPLPLKLSPHSGPDVYFDVANPSNSITTIELSYFLVTQNTQQSGGYTDAGLVLAKDDAHPNRKGYTRVAFFIHSYAIRSESLFDEGLEEDTFTIY